MPVYPRKRKAADGRPVWRIKVWVAGVSHEKLSPGTKAEAKLEEARWRVELESAGPPQRSRGAPSFSTFCAERYQDHARAHLAPSTWAVRKFQLENLARHLGGVKLTAIDTAAVDAYKAARTAEGAQPGTVNTELAKLQAVLTYARDVGEPCASPKVRLLPVRGTGRVKFWTSEQIAALFAACEKVAPDLLPLVTFLANTGCRKGEGLACEKAWIDIDADMIRIEPNAYWQPKDREPREIPISPALRPFLARALADKDNASRYVFVATRKSMGRTQRTRWAAWPKRAFDEAVKAAGLKGGPHKLRHTFASHFLKGCPDMFLLAQVLGQSHTRTTEIYSHLLPDHLAKARGVVNLAPGTGPAAMEARKRWATK